MKSYQTKCKVFGEKGTTSSTKDKIQTYDSDFPEKIIK